MTLVEEEKTPGVFGAEGIPLLYFLRRATDRGI